MKLAPEITIRLFAITDYDAVIALWKEADLPYREHGRDSRSRIAKEISQSNCHFLVAETSGKIIGTVLGTQDGRKGWINRLAVAKDFQRHNIARALVDAVENHYKDLGIDVVACIIEAENQDSQEFFKNVGYIKYPDIYYYSKRKNPLA